ncbi:hypothetical protein ACRBU7_28550 (plasmid) [Priestia aryabhattai]|uniref:hypothetical protein n=1 Tax=Priestia TaxID=2800373 RepID=UPI000BF357D5|nr:hypothetical protein [Priestia megaterium]PFL68488.1 hypothetical protein COJ36_06765 [Priestia megaterium]PGN04227.1 hypothetical protein CN955_21945 [Priestia megaterium]QDZ88303.1 hypothetical protein D0441_28965 [Priestia megaterium]
MNKLLILTIASEMFLLVPFLIIYLTTRKTKKSLPLIILLIIGGAPLLYLAIDDMNSNYMDANIGLGLAFMFTWIYSTIAFIVAIILIVKRKRNNNISKEQ